MPYAHRALLCVRLRANLFASVGARLLVPLNMCLGCTAFSLSLKATALPHSAQAAAQTLKSPTQIAVRAPKSQPSVRRRVLAKLLTNQLGTLVNLLVPIGTSFLKRPVAGSLTRRPATQKGRASCTGPRCQNWPCLGGRCPYRLVWIEGTNRSRFNGQGLYPGQGPRQGQRAGLILLYLWII